MKIIGGKFKNRNFYMPATIRPTQNMLRKALFDIIGQDLEGLTFLDLFAGSGAMGLEALSRGGAMQLYITTNRWRRYFQGSADRTLPSLPVGDVLVNAIQL